MPRNKESIEYMAHLDVVDEGEGWDYEPYVPTVRRLLHRARLPGQ